MKNINMTKKNKARAISRDVLGASVSGVELVEIEMLHCMSMIEHRARIKIKKKIEWLYRHQANRRQ